MRALFFTLFLVGCGSSVEDVAATPLPNEEQEAGLEIGPADVTTPPRGRDHQRRR